jgi:hypothetical protein
MRYFIAVVLLIFVAEQPVSASVPSWHKKCQRIYKQYKTKGTHKAFAISPQSSSWVACAAVFNAGSKSAAEAAALKDCNRLSTSACYIMESK